MKIFVHESITGGGFDSSRIAPTLLAEGRMMLEALVTDLLCLEEHELLLLIDRRRVDRVPPHRRLRVVDLRKSYRQGYTDMVEEADAALLIAPETGGFLEELTAVVEARGKFVLGSSSLGVKSAADKALTYQLLQASGIPTPVTHEVRHSDELVPLARQIGYPVVVKPRDGVGCQSVFFARRDEELQRAFATARRETRQETVLLQSYVEGVHASVSLLTDGMRCLPLTLNLQEIGGRTRVRYHGGQVPLEHPRRPLAFRRAREVVAAIPGLRGYVGIDVVLTDRDAVVIEVNPRVTTSYVGLRKVLRSNPAALMLGAAGGNLPDPGEIEIVGTARFTTRSTGGANLRGVRWSA
ncbi:MAG TPA: ATP-grasp domain-containing protein [Candidatus Methylomirabilis sp.]|nr:ATP-grasp domain-containing protein [Candidatus Methylomirabilis sp.]